MEEADGVADDSQFNEEGHRETGDTVDTTSPAAIQDFITKVESFVPDSGEQLWEFIQKSVPTSKSKMGFTCTMTRLMKALILQNKLPLALKGFDF